MDVAETIIDVCRRIARAEMRQNALEFVFGTVTGVDPLTIRVGAETDENSYEIDEDFLVLSPFCRRTVLGVPSLDHAEHLHEIDAKTETATTGIVITGQATMVDEGHTHSIKIKTKTALPEMLLWRGLEKNDRVMILKLPGGTLFWVIQRVEKVENPADLNDDGTIKDNNDEVNWP